MRKILIAFSLILCFINVKAQITYHNYLDCSSEWRYYVGGSTFGGSFKGYFTVYFDGDTLINGDYYYRQKALFRYQGSSAIEKYKNNFIREDNNLNFIGSCNYGQLLRSSSIIDTLYKFALNSTLQVSDSMPDLTKPQINFYPYEPYCNIVRLDSFFLGNRKLKAYSPISISYLSVIKIYPDLVEGVGATYPNFCSNGCCDRPILYLYYYNKNSDTVAFNSTSFKYPYDSFPTPIRVNACSVLPLKILSFTAQKENNIVKLNWQTANEINVNHINIQRSSNGKEFENIGKQNASCCSYNFTDPLTTIHLPLTIYYRLEIVDKDGSKTYSEIRNVELRIRNKVISIYPNPSKGNVTIETNNAIKLEVIDYLGRTVHIVSNTHQSGLHNFTIAKGLYFVKAILANGDYKIEKLIVE